MSKELSSAGSGLESRTVTFKGWKALEVKNRDLRLIFTPQVGGRISGCSFRGKELFYTHPPLEGVVPPPDRASREFLHYGGHKTWLAPQEEWPDALPFYDLDSGAYEWAVEENPSEIRVGLKSPVCRESGVQLVKEVIVNAGPEVRIRQTMTNRSGRPVSRGLWDVTQLLRPATVFMPLKPRSDFAGGIKVFETENRNRDEVLRHVRSGGRFAAVSCDDSTLFKVGSDSEEGWLMGFFAHGEKWTVFRKTFQTTPGRPGGHGCTAEVFNSDERPHCEMEIHSALARLAPGESFRWESSWFFAESRTLPSSRDELQPFLDPVKL